VPIIAGATGWDFDVAEFRKSGERIYNLARLFNTREGCTRADDTLPKRLTEEPLTDGPAEGLVVDLEPLLDAYYGFRGWDKSTGIPTSAVVSDLGLDKLVEKRG